MELDAKARADVEAALQPGEKILWAAAHEWRRSFNRAAGALGALVAAVAILLLLVLGTERVALAISGMVVAGFVLIVALVLMVVYWTRRRVYVITDRGAIVIRRDPLLAVDRHQPSAATLSVVVRDDGSGDLILATRRILETTQQLGFFGVREVRSVERVLRAAPFFHERTENRARR